MTFANISNNFYRSSMSDILSISYMDLKSNINIPFSCLFHFLHILQVSINLFDFVMHCNLFTFMSELC